MKDKFFDYNSTTPVAPSVLKAMIPYFSEIFANPSGQTSDLSFQAQSAIKVSKEKIAKALGSSSADVFFTSGATESINWVVSNFKKEGRSILLSPIEHDACYKACCEYSKSVFFEVEKNGQLQKEDFLEKLNALPEGSLVSILWGHNELGTLFNQTELLQEVKNKGHYLHVDATQCIGKVPFNAIEIQADFVSLSAHKFYGPKGIGALIINQNSVSGFAPMICGGGQQSNFRSGTLNTPLIVGLGESISLAEELRNRDVEHFKVLKEAFLKELSELSFTQNGDPESCLPNTLNLSFPEWRSFKALHLCLRPFSVSQASACSGEKSEARVLTKLGIDPSQTIRISFGRDSKLEDSLALAQKIKETLKSS